MKTYLRIWLLALLLLTSSISTMGCSIGVKEKVRIIYVRVNKEPDEVVKLIRVASNKPITVTINGTETALDAGGMLLMPEDHVAELIRRAK